DGYADQQHNEPEEKASAWKQGGKEPGKKLCNISQKEHIDHCSQTNLFTVHDQGKYEKQQAEYGIESSVADWRQVPKSVGQDLERIHPKGRIVEKSHGHAAGSDPRHSHHHTS